MVLTDKHLQIATALTFDGGNGTAFIGDTVDLGTNRRIESGKPLYVRCTFTESASASASALNAKTEFRFRVAALSSLSNFGAVSSVVTVEAGDDYNLFTLAGHGLVNGSRLNVAATSTGLVTTRPYYVINATADTFQISWLPGGVASTALSTTNATVTFTPHSECVGSSGPTPIQQTQIGDVIHVALNPTPFNQGVPLARYLFCEVIRSGGTSTAGEVSMALVLDASDYATYYASGFTVE